jgi:hypothetical protein
MEKRKANIIFNKNGQGFTTIKITLPVGWIREMGFTENDKKAVIEFKDKEIKIKKETKEMNRFEIIEKMFEKLNIIVDGREIWNLIENDINSNGKTDGVHSVELGKLGDNRDLCFAEVEIKMNYSEEDDTYVTDIEILSISNSKEVIYPEDIEV